MHHSLRKSLVLPQVPAQLLFGVGTVASFLWLLTQDLVEPLAVYLLQLYLTF